MTDYSTILKKAKREIVVFTKKILPERLGIRLLKADRQGELHHSAKNEVHR